jgi:hypothetical protein
VITILQGDCRERLKEMAAGSVHCYDPWLCWGTQGPSSWRLLAESNLQWFESKRITSQASRGAAVARAMWEATG